MDDLTKAIAHISHFCREANIDNMPSIILKFENKRDKFNFEMTAKDKLTKQYVAPRCLYRWDRNLRHKGISIMTDIEALCEHRTKIVAMKTALLSKTYTSSFTSSRLDADIANIDKMIEIALRSARPVVIKKSIYDRRRP